MPKKKLMRYARGLGIKLDDDYTGDNPLDFIRPLNQTDVTLATNAQLFQ
jgi:hypothetical protein